MTLYEVKLEVGSDIKVSCVVSAATVQEAIDVAQAKIQNHRNKMRTVSVAEYKP